MNSFKICRECTEKLPATEEFFRFKYCSKRAKNKTAYYICKICETKKNKEYNARPEVIEKRRLWKRKWQQKPENKIKRKSKYQNDKEYRDCILSKKKAWNNKPENKIKRYNYNQKPEVKERKKIYDIEYRKTNKEKISKQSKKRSLQPEKKFNSYLNGAKKRNINWNLSYNEFITFWQKPCFYCNGSISTIGLDRVNNNKGYSLDNLVSCCKICNRMKSNMDYVDWINQIKKLFANQGGVSTGA